MTSPLVSVIIPTYNRATKMGRATNSIFNQTFPDWEMVIIDDGSTDHTHAAVTELQKQHPDKTITYLHQNNAGPSAARNNGVNNALGEIIVYLDSDDQLYASALEDIIWTLKDETVLYGIPNHNRTLVLVDKDGVELARKFDAEGLNKSLDLQNFYDWQVKTTTSGLFHRKSIFTDGIQWRSDFWIEDLEFMFQLAVKYPTGFRHIEKVLVDYVQTYGADGLCSNARYSDWAHAFGAIYELHKNDSLMKNPRIYLDRIERYNLLHQQDLQGKAVPPYYKFFPEFFNAKDQSEKPL